MDRRALESIESDECLELLAQKHVGRLVFDDEHGPAALPVIYALAGDEIVFRSEGGSKIDALHGQRIAFEVDDVDEVSHTGWSVLVRGTSREAALDDLPELVRRFDGDVPLPWKKGVHNIWVVITATELTGRRLGGYVFENSD